MLLHPDHFWAIDEADTGGVAVAVLGDLRLDARQVADQDHLIGVRGRVVDRAAHHLARSVIAAHRVDRDPHRRRSSQRWPSAGVVGSTGKTSRPL